MNVRKFRVPRLFVLHGGIAHGHAIKACLHVLELKGASLRLVITGASGFVGRHLVSASVQRGCDVRAIVRRPIEFQGAHTVQIPDITADIDWMAQLDGVEAVVHLAALAHVTSGISEAEYHRINTAPAVKLAKAAAFAKVRASGARV